MKMRLSRYVHLFTRGNSCYLYNIETNFFCEIDRRLFKLLKDRDFNGLDEEEMLFLKQKKVLISEDEVDNFVLEANFKFRVNSCNQDMLSLVIAPTTACNFACPYCFEENKKPEVITDAVVGKLVVFINEHVNAKQLEIVWYGGEPLLAFAQIKKIIASIGNNVKIPIAHQRLITNGYLLSPEVVDFFQNQNLTAIQVTLDGGRDSHNKTRCTKAGGTATFDTIINNVDFVLSQMPNTRVTIRVNVNSENKDEFFPLYKDLSIRWKGKNVYIYPGLIRVDTKDKLSLCCSCITDSNATDFYNELKLQGANLNYRNKGLDVLANVRWNDKEYHKKQEIDQLMGANSLLMPTNEVVRNQNLAATASVNYEVSEWHTMGARYIFDYDPLNRYSSFTNYAINENETGSIIHSANNLDNPRRGRLNAYYTGTITDKFSLRADFDLVQNQTSQIMHSLSQQVQAIDNVVTAQSKGNASVYGGKIQGVVGLFKGELTLGGELVKTTNEQKYRIVNAQNITPETQNKAATDLSASFISYQIPIKEMLSLQAGLRYEHSSFSYSIDGVAAPQQSKDYNLWAPSISLGYAWKFINVGINYGRRVIRPSYYQLRNDVQYSTPYLYESGNPFLKPAMSNDIGLNVGLGSLSIMAIYSKITDMIVYSLSDYNATGVMLFKPENVEESENFGLMLSVDASLDVWEPTLEAGFQKQFLTWGKKSFNKPIYTVGMHNKIKFPKGVSLMVDFDYASRGNSSTVYTDYSFVTNVFLSKWFFNKTLRINMGFDNIFDANETWKLELDNFSMYKDCNNDSRRIFVSIYFLFNNAKSRFKGEKSTDEIDRI